MIYSHKYISDLNKLSMLSKKKCRFKFNNCERNETRWRKVTLRIEDKWEDGILYSVEFQVSLEGTVKNIRRNVVLPEELDFLELEKLVKKSFNLVTKVLFVEYCSDVLLLKNNG